MEVEAGIKVLNIPRMRGQHGDVAINTGIITMLTPNGQQTQTLIELTLNRPCYLQN